MLSVRSLLPLLLALTSLTACAEAREEIPPLRDLPAEAAASRLSGQPIVLFFHSRTCPYCQLVEENYLRWVMEENTRAPRIRLRAVDIDSDAQLIRFDGAVTTPRAFARERGVRLVPHLQFVGSAGEKLSADLIGVSIPDYYAGYLEDAIRESVEKLRRR